MFFVCVCQEASSEERVIKQFHFTAWPDHGVPYGTETLIQFRGLIRHHIDNSQNPGPTVTHCRYKSQLPVYYSGSSPCSLKSKTKKMNCTLCGKRLSIATHCFYLYQTSCCCMFCVARCCVYNLSHFPPVSI